MSRKMFDHFPGYSGVLGGPRPILSIVHFPYLLIGQFNIRQTTLPSLCFTKFLLHSWTWRKAAVIKTHLHFDKRFTFNATISCQRAKKWNQDITNYSALLSFQNKVEWEKRVMNRYEFHRICGLFLDTLVHNKRHSRCRKMIPRSVSTMLFIISGSWHLVICSNLVQWKACQQLTSSTRINWPSIMASHYELQIVWSSKIYVKSNQWGKFQGDR